MTLAFGDRRVLRRIATVVVLACVPCVVSAQINAPAGRTVFNRTVMVRSFLRIDNFDEPVAGQRVRRFVNPYALVWGAYPNLSLTFVAPLAVVQNRDGNDPSRNFTRTSFADGAIFARYDLFRKNVPRGYTRISPEIGVKVPSGGVFSTGSTDFLGTLVFSHWRDPHAVVVDAQFTYATPNDQGLRRGHQWNYDVAYLYRVLPRRQLGAPTMYLVLEMNGEHTRRSSLSGNLLPNSGGNVVFLSPGIELLPNNRFVLEFSAPVAVVRDLNGAQPQPSVSLLFGVRWVY